MWDGVVDGGEDGDEDEEGADDEDDDDSKPLEQLAASKQQADDKEEEQQEAAAGKKGGKCKQPATKPKKKKKRKQQQQAAKLTDEQKGQVGGGEAGISIISPTGGTDEVGPGVCCRVSCRTTVCLAGPRAWTCSASRSCSCPSTSTSTGEYVSHTLLQPTLTQRPALTPCRLAGSVCVCQEPGGDLQPAVCGAADRGGRLASAHQHRQEAAAAAAEEAQEAATTSTATTTSTTKLAAGQVGLKAVAQRKECAGLLCVS